MYFFFVMYASLVRDFALVFLYRNDLILMEQLEKEIQNIVLYYIQSGLTTFVKALITYTDDLS